MTTDAAYSVRMHDISEHPAGDETSTNCGLSCGEALCVCYLNATSQACRPVAGMSDVLAPFLEIFPSDDALAYLCFSALMQRIRQNFLEGQPGIHSSLQQIIGLLQTIDKKLCTQIGMHLSSCMRYWHYTRTHDSNARYFSCWCCPCS